MMDRKPVPKHVVSYSKNKFEKLVHILGFIIRKIYGSSVWNLVHVTLLGPRIMKWLLDFWNICAFLPLCKHKTSW
jgi:hypothetical protein